MLQFPCVFLAFALMTASCGTWHARPVGGPSLGQEPQVQKSELPAEMGPSHSSLDLGFDNTGLSFGNSESWNGLRINLRDRGVQQVNGINLTLWSPPEDAVGQIDGLAIGIQTRADRVNGVSLGLLAATANEQMTGLQFGTLATVSEGSMVGINLSGLATVANGSMIGLNLGGLATVSDHHMEGVNLGGLALVADGRLRGVNLGGLAVRYRGARRVSTWVVWPW